VCNLFTSLYDTLIKLAEAYDERHDIVETGDWLKERIWAHKDTVTCVLTIPLPPSALQDPFRGIDPEQSVRGRLSQTKRKNDVGYSVSGIMTARPPRLRFLTTSLDKTIRLWDTSVSMKGHRREQCIRTFRGHTKGVTCLAMLGNPNHRRIPDRSLVQCDEEAERTTYFVSGCRNGNCKLWNLAGDCIRSYYLPVQTNREKAVTCVAALVDGISFVAGYQSGSARLWDAWSGMCIGLYSGHMQPITCITSMQDRTSFVTGSVDGNMKLWYIKSSLASLSEDDIIEEGSEDSSEKSSPNLSSRVTPFLSGISEETACVKCFSNPSHSAVLSLACVEPSKVFVSGSVDGIARIWSAEMKQCIRSLVGHGGPVSAVISIDRSTILTGSHDKTAKIWDAAAGACLRTYTGQEGSVTSLSVAQDNTTFLASVKQMVKIWLISSVPRYLPEDDTLDCILEANLSYCRGGQCI
jgi:WD40 repeat protein